MNFVNIFLSISIIIGSSSSGYVYKTANFGEQCSNKPPFISLCTGEGLQCIDDTVCLCGPTYIYNNTTQKCEKACDAIKHDEYMFVNGTEFVWESYGYEMDGTLEHCLKSCTEDKACLSVKKYQGICWFTHVNDNMVHNTIYGFRSRSWYAVSAIKRCVCNSAMTNN